MVNLKPYEVILYLQLLNKFSQTFKVLSIEIFHVSKINIGITLTIWTDIFINVICFWLKNSNTASVKPILTAITTDVEPAKDKHAFSILRPQKERPRTVASSICLLLYFPLGHTNQPKALVTLCLKHVEDASLSDTDTANNVIGKLPDLIFNTQWETKLQCLRSHWTQCFLFSIRLTTQTMTHSQRSFRQKILQNTTNVFMDVIHHSVFI